MARLGRFGECVAAALAGLASGCAVAGAAPAAAGGDASVYAAPWRWTDEEGSTVALSRWRGEPVILAPFYASCSERCPRTLEKVRSVDEAYARHGVAHQVILVTLDPGSDGPERLRRFKEQRHVPASWRVLRGEIEETRALARMLGVRAIYDDTHVDHDVRIAVFDGSGRLVRDFGGWDFDDDDAVLR
jgi:protein SCO1